MRVLLDSGVCSSLNVGDLALLDESKRLFDGCEVRVLNADKQNVLGSILWCDFYFMVAGGLLKDVGEVRLMVRKLFAVFVARLLCKQVFVDSQTVYLHGFWFAVFRLVFWHLPFLVRDGYSFYDCRNSGLFCLLGYEPLLRKVDYGKCDVIVVDGRFVNLNFDCLSFLVLLEFLKNITGFPVVFVNSLFVDDYVETERLFGSASVVLAFSYHACVFGLNGGARVFFVKDSVFVDYALRKLSVLLE